MCQVCNLRLGITIPSGNLSFPRRQDDGHQTESETLRHRHGVGSFRAEVDPGDVLKLFITNRDKWTVLLMPFDRLNNWKNICEAR